MTTTKIASLKELQDGGKDIHRLPFSIRILLENILRNQDNFTVTKEHAELLINWDAQNSEKDIPFKPSRVLMQDFTGVPAVVDIASLREEYIAQGKDGSKINPAIPVDLVIDHSVQVDYYGTDYAYKDNVQTEYQRNSERYELLKWAQQGLTNFTVVPPAMGICHQVNLEYLCSVVSQKDGWTFPDTLVGTDSHTPMVNGIGVIAWGVGGIEAEAAMLGQPIYITTPKVVGLKLSGKLPVGVTATDLVLNITQSLRKHQVVGCFVEVFGDALDHLSVTDRATIANMSPEFGCTVTYFPVDEQTIDYLLKTNRDPQKVAVVEQYCKENMLWRTGKENITYSSIVEVDLNLLEPTVAGPSRPQDKILVKDLGNQFTNLLLEDYNRNYQQKNERAEYAFLSEGGGQTQYTLRDNVASAPSTQVIRESMRTVRIKQQNKEYVIGDGSIVLAAITSCTNTSNPKVMLGAGLVARKALQRGLRTKSWVKTSLAPGSKVVTKYLERAGLLEDLQALRFHNVGYGCTSCIGNSGPLPPPIAQAVDRADLVVASVLSGNRNFEARVHPQIKMNFLMSPMLVVAYALVGRIDIDLINEPLDYDPNGEPVFLKDIWPTEQEIQDVVDQCVLKQDFEDVYSVIFEGDKNWKDLDAPKGDKYIWNDKSTYIKQVPFFEHLPLEPAKLSNIEQARVLLYLGDSVTTDHISPAGSFNSESAAGKYLISLGVAPRDFNSYGSRRGNHEVMVRGTFANVRIKNKIASKEGGFSTFFPNNETLSVYETAQKYKQTNTPLIVLAGKEYGSGSSRDWAAKGTFLLGVKAVIAQSYERIHRSNLIGMGVAPLEFLEGQSAESIGLNGTEIFDIFGLDTDLELGKILEVKALNPTSKQTLTFQVKARFDSNIEIEYFKNQGILQYVLRDFLK